MGVAHTTHKFFSRTTEVNISIDAPIQCVWDVLSDLENYSQWNSTIIMSTGQFKQGGTVSLITTLAPEKNSRLKLKI